MVLKIVHVVFSDFSDVFHVICASQAYCIQICEIFTYLFFAKIGKDLLPVYPVHANPELKEDLFEKMYFSGSYERCLILNSLRILEPS